MLDLKQLQILSASRMKRWHDEETWTPLEWAGAMCGEAGETANAAKKLRRVEAQMLHHDTRTFGVQMSLQEQKDLYRKQMAKEAADTVLYALLVCESIGADLETAIAEVFNQKSIEYGFPERILLDGRMPDVIRHCAHGAFSALAPCTHCDPLRR